MMAGKILKRTEISERLDLKNRLQLKESSKADLAPVSGHILRREVRDSVDEANRIIHEAHEEAGRIKREAADILGKVGQELEEARKRGIEEGKNEGLAQVSKMLVAANHQKEKMFEGLERDMVRLVYDIAEKILGKDMSEREAAIVDLIRQALHAAIGQKIIILVHPSDLEVVRKNQGALMQVLDVSKTIQIRGEEKVAPKGCLIETEIGTIDAQLETQLTAIREALGIVEEEKKEREVLT